MLWWQTFIVSLSSSVVGGLLTASGSLLLLRWQQRSRRREEDLRAIGAALGALRELSPGVYAERLQGDPRRAELFAEMRSRWLAASESLDVLAALHPDTQIADLAEAIIERGRLVLVRLDEVVKGATLESQAWWDVIPAAHQEAIDKARQLVRLVESEAV